MKKLVIASLLLIGAASASAQENDKYYSESWKDNIFISVGGGVQSTVNGYNSFGTAMTPVINLSLGKYITPTWGVRAQIYGWNSKQETDWTGKMQELENNYFGANLDAIVNLTNLFCGYKPGRTFELNFFVGPSMNIAKTMGAGMSVDITGSASNPNVDVANNGEEKTRALVGASLGLGAKFNLNEKWAIDVEARGQVTPSIHGAKSSNRTAEGYGYITAGVTHTFGGKKFVKACTLDHDAINAEVNKYRSELAQAQADLANAKNALANMKPEVREVVKVIEAAGARAIFFKIGSARLDDYGKVNLELAAKALKANPDRKYKIAGYCDKATGSVSGNQKLSEKRAQVVYDTLVGMGVDKDQLELVGFGGTENMFGKNALNRVVILE